MALFVLRRHKVVDHNFQLLLPKHVLEDVADFFPFQAVDSTANPRDSQLINSVFALF